MPADLDVNVPATTSGLRQALAALEALCVARSLHADMVAKARIVVEELFTNTIKYGYLGECQRPVRLSVIAAPLTVVFEDEAPPFDPTQWRPSQPAPERALDRPVGQAGIALIIGLSVTLRYERLANGNRVTTVLAIDT